MVEGFWKEALRHHGGGVLLQPSEIIAALGCLGCWTHVVDGAFVVVLRMQLFSLFDFESLMSWRMRSPGAHWQRGEWGMEKEVHRRRIFIVAHSGEGAGGARNVGIDD